MAVLYRKYRPQTFADVVGQDHVTRVLVSAIAHDRIAHAYLFSGPRGVGKTTIARLLAKAVNCARRWTLDAGRDTQDASPLASGVERQASSVVPCNACDLCSAITAGQCVDVIEIDAASHTGVDHVREEIIEHARVAPSRGREKVFIIDEVHMLSASAFNALLKTIEEPPAHVRFILATTELHRVPDTIRSRCQHFAFRRVDAGALAHRLATLAAAEGVTVDDGILAQIVRLSDGSVRDAESTLGQLLAIGGSAVDADTAALVLPCSAQTFVRALLSAVARGDAAAALDAIDTAERSGVDPEQFVRDGLAAARDALHSDVRVSGGAPTTLHIAMLRSFAALADAIAKSDHPFFAIEVAVLELLAMHPVTTPECNTAAVPPDARRSLPDRPRDPPSGTPPLVERAISIHPVAASPRGDAGPSPADRATDEVSPNAERVEPSARSDAPISESDPLLGRVRGAWGEVVRLASKSHVSMSYLLEGGRPREVANGTLTIGFRYRLHAEKIAHPTLHDALVGVLTAILGQPLRIATAVVSEEEFRALDTASRPVTGDAVADAALEVFGGKVVS